MSKSDFVNSIYQAALAAGLSDAAARVMASQGALESEYGGKAPGNNLFGVKAGKSWTGPTQKLTTHEYVGGQRTKTKDNFRVYDSPEAAIADRVKFMASRFPAFNNATTVGDAYDALQNGRYGAYYTAPRDKYEAATNWVNQQYLGGAPVPPGNIPAVGTELSVTPPTIKGPAAKGASATALRAPLPFPGVLAPPPLPRPRPGYPQSDFNMAPPNLPLNTQVPAGSGDSWGPTAGTWGPQNFANGFPGAPAVPPRLGALAGASRLAGAARGADGVVPLPSAPIPMPARPAALNTPAIAPQTPQQAAPPPIPAQRTPSSPPAPVAQQVRLASGKMIAPGVYPGSDGSHQIQISDDGQGNAKISTLRGVGEIPGLINPMHEMSAPTLAGNLIRNKVPEAIGQGFAGVQRTAADAVNGLGSNIQGFGSTIGNAFGGLFGQHPPAVSPWAPAGSFYFPPQRQQQAPPPVPRNRPFNLFAPQQQQRSVSVPVARHASAAPAPVQSNGGGNGGDSGGLKWWQQNAMNVDKNGNWLG